MLKCSDSDSDNLGQIKWVVRAVRELGITRFQVQHPKPLTLHKMVYAKIYIMVL